MKHAVLSVLFLMSPILLGAQVIVDHDFSLFPQGNLAGQQGWVQFGTIATNPIRVVNANAMWTGGATVDNQDVMYPFTDVIPAPSSGTATLYVDFRIRITSSGPSPSYFLALNTLNTTTSADGNFANARIAARDEGSNTYRFGVRVTGQSGYPFVWSTDTYGYGQLQAVRMVVRMEAGEQNDAIDLYVGPDFDNLTLQATSEYTSGTGTDPVSYGGLLLSQFGSETVNQSGVAIRSVKVHVPTATSVRDDGRGTMDVVELHQNYPNPFNPTTVIRFAIVEAHHDAPLYSTGTHMGTPHKNTGAHMGTPVRLAVYDVLGREVAILVHNMLSSGSHYVNFDAAGLPSGVYIYRLEAGGETLTRRMTLVK